MLKRIFRPRTEEISGGWRKIHNKELNNSFSSLHVIRAIKSRKRKCKGM
jgi:hypothetical protein